VPLIKITIRGRDETVVILKRGCWVPFADWHRWLRSIRRPFGISVETEFPNAQTKAAQEQGSSKATVEAQARPPTRRKG
jgi:hypothetical protein